MRILKSKEFWIGFIAAYVISMFLPASRLTSAGRGKSASPSAMGR